MSSGTEEESGQEEHMLKQSALGVSSLIVLLLVLERSPKNSLPCLCLRDQCGSEAKTASAQGCSLTHHGGGGGDVYVMRLFCKILQFLESR